MTLLTPADIAAMLQVHPKTAAQVIRSPGFPAPAVDHSRKLRLWIKDSVEKWLREQVWGWRQIKRVLRAPATGKTKEVQDAFHIALRTAMRLQEVLAAPALFDKEKQIVRLPAELDKMGRRRDIPIGRIAAKLLQRPAFVVDPNEASTLFADLLGCIGISGMMFRDSRATALTLLARKVDVMRLQKISGHKDVRMLSRYYRESATDISKLI